MAIFTERDTEGRTYYRRKLAEGKSEKEALRCLKRRISDTVFKKLYSRTWRVESRTWLDTQRAFFTQASIDLGDGLSFTVEAPDTSESNMYVQSASLDGETLDRAWLRHEEISQGGRLFLEMGDNPSDWGRDDRPPSVSSPDEGRTPGVDIDYLPYEEQDAEDHQDNA